MPLTINDFKAISNGSYNVGQIKLDDKGGLAKVNNHVWKTSQNNVQLTANQNRAVRQQLLSALQEAGTIKDATYTQMKTILLGEGRDTHSLGRDFVKHLINSAEHGNIDSKFIERMKTAEKSLLNRNVLVKGARPKVDEGLMTSTSKVAFETYANEAMDQAATKAREGMDVILKVYDVPVTRSEESPKGVARATRGIVELLVSDVRLRDMPGKDEAIGRNRRSLVANLHKLAETFAKNINNIALLDLPDGQQRYAATFEREVRALYANANIPKDIQADHFSRIFPHPTHFAETADKLRTAFSGFSTGDIYKDPGYVTNVLNLRQNILIGIINEIEKVPNASDREKTVTRELLVRASGSQPQAEALKTLAKKNMPADMIKVFNDFMTEEIKGFFDVRDMLPIAVGQDILKSLHQLGMGV